MAKVPNSIWQEILKRISIVSRLSHAVHTQCPGCRISVFIWLYFAENPRTKGSGPFEHRGYFLGVQRQGANLRARRLAIPYQRWYCVPPFWSEWSTFVWSEKKLMVVSGDGVRVSIRNYYLCMCMCPTLEIIISPIKQLNYLNSENARVS